MRGLQVGGDHSVDIPVAPRFIPSPPFRHEYRRRTRLTELNFPPMRTFLFLLLLSLAIRSRNALKLLVSGTCIALLEWLDINDWVRSALTGLYRLYFHHAAPNTNWERRVQVLAHIVHYNEAYHYVLKMVCIALLSFMLPLRLLPSMMLAAMAFFEEGRDLVEQASVYEWIIDNAAGDDDGDGAPASA